MTAATLFGLCSAALVGLGLFGVVTHPQPLRKILAFNLLGGGVFLMFGVIARRGGAAGLGGDPVPQAMVITGIVVAFAATALAVGLLLRLFGETSGASLGAGILAQAAPARRPLMATAGGFLLVLAIFLPVGGVLASVAFGGRYAERAAAIALPAGLGVAFAIMAQVWRSGHPLQYLLGGWEPPLGVALRADGFSAVMVLTTALVTCGIGLFAAPVFRTGDGTPEVRAPLVFWAMLLALCGALNAVWLGGDLFTLYVALELLTFGAVPLVCLDGRAETLAAALRYLLFVLLGSVLYLLGVALLYGAYGTLDIALLAGRVRAEPVVFVAAALMTAGLMAKTALFPLHLWLPPAHAGAPAAASALLSALAAKGSLFLILRLWFGVLPGLLHPMAAQSLAALGAAAIVFGSVLALRQARLKLLIAYSTVAQIGYLFFVLPLASGAAMGQPPTGLAWTGGVLQIVSHAVAKAAMFLAAGLIGEALGHDRIAGLGGVGRALPVTVFAFGLGGMSLMGLPPSGGFVAKAFLLMAAVREGQWWWAVVILTGGLLAGGYVFRVLLAALASPVEPLILSAPVSRRREAAVLALALCAVLLGLIPLRPSQLLQIGLPAASGIVSQ